MFAGFEGGVLKMALMPEKISLLKTQLILLCMGHFLTKKHSIIVAYCQSVPHQGMKVPTPVNR
jgi:hypothetical protein